MESVLAAEQDDSLAKPLYSTAPSPIQPYWMARYLKACPKDPSAATGLAVLCENESDYVSEAAVLKNAQLSRDEIASARLGYAEDLIAAQRHYTGKEPEASTDLAEPKLHDTPAVREAKHIRTLYEENIRIRRNISQGIAAKVDSALPDLTQPLQSMQALLLKSKKKRASGQNGAAVLMILLAALCACAGYFSGLLIPGVAAAALLLILIPKVRKRVRRSANRAFEKTYLATVRRLNLLSIIEEAEKERVAQERQLAQNDEAIRAFWEKYEISQAFQSYNDIVAICYLAALGGVSSIRELSYSKPVPATITVPAWVGELCQSQRDLGRFIVETYENKSLPFGKSLALEMLLYYQKAVLGQKEPVSSLGKIDPNRLFRLETELYSHDRALSKVARELAMLYCPILKPEDYEYQMYMACRVTDPTAARDWLRKSAAARNPNAIYLAAMDREALGLDPLQANSYARSALDAAKNPGRYSQKLVFTVRDAKKLAGHTEYEFQDHLDTLNFEHNQMVDQQIRREQEREEQRRRQFNEQMDNLERDLNDLAGEGWHTEEELALQGKRSAADSSRNSLLRHQLEQKYTEE